MTGRVDLKDTSSTASGPPSPQGEGKGSGEVTTFLFLRTFLRAGESPQGEGKGNGNGWLRGWEKQGGFDEGYDVCIVPYDEVGMRTGLFFPQRRLCRQFTIAIAINSRNRWFQFTTAGQFTLLSFFATL